jgi:ATP-dependent helicase/nuclease subunit B
LPVSRGSAPAVSFISAEASFADALAIELIRRHGSDPLALARGRILLPNARSVRTVTEAFVRASGRGLLLPRLVPIGDPTLDERIGGALEVPGGDPIPPAIDPLTRQAELARLIQVERNSSAAESWRLAGELGRTLDQLLIEEVDPRSLLELEADTAELAGHQQKAITQLSVLLERWPERLKALGRIDLTDRRNRLLRATARRWQAVPPPGFTVAAGITSAAPAIASLLEVVARMPDGEVVLPGLADDRLMPEAQWQALGPEGEAGERPEPTHPQYHLKLLLERMNVNRAEVRPWPVETPQSCRARVRVAAQALTAARFSQGWSRLPPKERRLSGVRLAILPDPAAEAQAIALALRQALEVPGRTAALVTPDRNLARRVAALLRRWDIEADDSAGTPLSLAAPGTLLLVLASAAAERLAPVSLLALLGHPLVKAGEGRQAWLDDLRRVDLALRGPRPPAGLAGLEQAVVARDSKSAVASWTRVRPAAELLESLFDTRLTLAGLAAALREIGTSLCGETLWSGQAGRAAADLLAELEVSESAAAIAVGLDDAVPLLRQLLDTVAIRPPYGQHPRIQILGLIEARLLKTDVMILGGLNEGVWPAAPSPDPWLPARLRTKLKLPGAEFRIGLAAHDFAGLLTAPEVLLTRSRRDGRSPTVSSRLLLRLQALTGGLPRHRAIERLALALDEPERETPVKRPAPCPPAADRPRHIHVTALDRLKADPFAFYAGAMLRLRTLDPLEAEQDARWKGDLVHKALEAWLKQDACAPDKLEARAQGLLAADDIHPMLRALWGPRLMEGIRSFVAKEAANQATGRIPLAAEAKGEADVAGVRLIGRVDRIDRLPDGRLAILDYKTGKPPSRAQVDDGFALQLGLLGLILRSGGFTDLKGEPGAHEYWSLARKHSGPFGHVEPMDAGDAAAFLARAHEVFADAVGKWLLGSEPFKAKLRPEYARDDYDQLMRLEEWAGRRS